MNPNIVLVTGMSGAGKSSAMNALEDLGYYCIDNFPKELLSNLEELFSSGSDKYANIALSVSAQDYLAFMKYFENLERPLTVVFLDCADDELLLRYRFTRRAHPMITSQKAATLEEAVEIERDYLNQVLANSPATLHIDTTRMTPQQLANGIRSRFKAEQARDALQLTIQSFGFKHGVPLDADEVIDVRFLPNPFYEPALRDKTGNDQEVYDYVMAAEETKEFTQRLKNYLDFVLDQYSRQNKNHVILAVGCTGGQHRSVSIANWLYDQYKEQYPSFISHRDISSEGE